MNDPVQLPKVRVAPVEANNRWSNLLQRILTAPQAQPADQERERLRTLRVLQRQLENARVYLSAAAQLEVDDELITSRVMLAERELDALLQVVTRSRR